MGTVPCPADRAPSQRPRPEMTLRSRFPGTAPRPVPRGRDRRCPWGAGPGCPAPGNALRVRRPAAPLEGMASQRARARVMIRTAVIAVPRTPEARFRDPADAPRHRGCPRPGGGSVRRSGIQPEPGRQLRPRRPESDPVLEYFQRDGDTQSRFPRLHDPDARDPATRWRSARHGPRPRPRWPPAGGRRPGSCRRALRAPLAGPARPTPHSHGWSRRLPCARYSWLESNSRTSGPRHSPTTSRSGRILRA